MDCITAPGYRFVRVALHSIYEQLSCSETGRAVASVEVTALLRRLQAVTQSQTKVKKNAALLQDDSTKTKK